MRILAEKNLVHRDIKGPNLLVSENDRGCIGDFGLIDEHKGGVQGTTLTPTYAAPFIWKNILDQRERKGHQGEAADVYALGVTMQYDILRPMIQQLAKEQQVDLSEFDKALNPTRVYTGPFTNDQLLEIEEEARSKGERAVYLAAVNNGQPKVVIYPSPERVFAATMNLSN